MRTFLLMKHHTNGHGCRVEAINLIKEVMEIAWWTTLAVGSMTEVLKMGGRRWGAKEISLKTRESIGKLKRKTR